MPSIPRGPPCRIENNCIWGGEVVATGTNGEGPYSLSRDYMLVRLAMRIPGSFNVRYAGWSVEETVPESATVIGHPNGMPMTIAYDHNPIEHNDRCDRQGMMWRLSVDEGQLIIGHSGSPVFDANERVRGNLLTGASCTGNSRSCAFSLRYNWTFGPPGSLLIDHLAGSDTRVPSLPSR